jgi:hypothetical protein
MRTWVKASLIGLITVVVGLMLLAGTGAYFFLRHLETRTASEEAAKQDFEAVRTRFTGRAPMIEVGDIQKGDLKIQRTAHPEGRRADTLHVITWEHEGELLKTDVPLWLMRFSSVNVLSHLGVAPSKYRLTVEDLKRFGPGIVVDYRRPGKNQVIIWLE